MMIFHSYVSLPDDIALIVDSWSQLNCFPCESMWHPSRRASKASRITRTPCPKPWFPGGTSGGAIDDLLEQDIYIYMEQEWTRYMDMYTYKKNIIISTCVYIIYINIIYIWWQFWSRITWGPNQSSWVYQCCGRAWMQTCTQIVGRMQFYVPQ